jgi:2-oxoglutarate dehydrogenase E1 component
VSQLDELTSGEFHTILPEIEEIDKIDPKKVESVIFCAGKVYYELLTLRKSNELNNKAIIRIEQLYPFPRELYQSVLKQYPHAVDIVWCQEEPQNQGAWTSLQPYLAEVNKGQQLRYAGRAASASPAAGYHAIHEKEQKELVEQALMT